MAFRPGKIGKNDQKQAQRAPRVVRASALTPTTPAHSDSSSESNSDIGSNRGTAPRESSSRSLPLRTKVVNIQERRNESKHSRFMYWAVRIAGLLAAVAISVFAVWALFFSPWLQLHADDVHVSGASKWINPQQITQITGERVGTSLIAISDSDVENKINDIAGVQSVHVEKKFPHGLDITIVEETPTVLLRAKNSSLLTAVDAQGRQITTIKQAEAGIPILDVKDAKRGLKNRSVQEGIAVLALLTSENRSRITQVEANTQDSITTKFSAGYTVVWGNSSSMKVKQQIVGKILEQVQQENLASVTIDVSAPSRPIVKS